MNAIESIELTSTSEHERELTVTIARDMVNHEFSTALKNKQRVATRPGFRPGKMPADMVMSFYGPQIKQDIIEKLMEKSFGEACRKENIIPVSRPKMEMVSEFAKEKPFTYKASFQIKPKLSVDNWKGLVVEIKDHVFDDEDIMDELKSVSESQARFVQPDSRIEIQECDLVECDSDVKIDGKINKDYSHKDYSVPLFAPNVPDDLKASLVGKKVGDVASVEYTMPEDHQDEAISGKKCEMLLTVKSFKERVLPKLDDEFAKDLSDKFKSLDELKDSVRLRFDLTAKRRNEYFKQDAITKALVEANPCEVPPAMIEHTTLSLINRELESMDKKAAQEIAEKHWEELWKMFHGRAIFRTKSELLMQELIEKLNIKASEEEIKKRIEKTKNLSHDDAEYTIEIEKLLIEIEKEANITKIAEPLFKKA